MTARRRAPRRRIPRRRQQPTTVEKGYGAQHKAVRAQMKRLVDSGYAICHRCGRWIDPREPWHAGHADVPNAKRLGIYAGPEHAACSHESGGWKRQGFASPPMRRTDQPTPRALAFFDTTESVVAEHDSGDEEEVIGR